MAEVSRLKFIQWRPIGVCDSGKGKERKAKMFSKSDLSIVLANGVSRSNWNENPEVLKLIERYAQDVIQLSSLTNEMKKPQIEDIQLVGAVLGHEKTPGLNRESSDGRVQFFQVSFCEGKQKSDPIWKKLLKYIMLAFIGLLLGILLFLLADRVTSFSTNKKTSISAECSTNRNSSVYSEELYQLQKSLNLELKQLPAWSTFQEARVACRGGRFAVSQQEQRLLQCFLTVKNRTSSLPASSRPDMSRIQTCARSMCQNPLPHLKKLCGRL